MFAVWVAIFVGLVVLNIAICVSVVAKPEDAASVIAERKNPLTLALYYSVLSMSRMDPQSDLAPSTPFPALVRNCRRRAVRRLQLFFGGAVVLALFIVTGHTPMWWSR